MISEQEAKVVIAQFVTNLRRRKIQGSSTIGKHTAEIIRGFVASLKRNDKIQQLIDLIRFFGKTMQEEKPTLLIIGNIVRRVLYIIREEYISGQRTVGEPHSLETQVAATPVGASSQIFNFNLPQQQDLHQPNLANLLEMGPEVDFCKTLEMFEDGTFVLFDHLFGLTSQNKRF